MPKTFLSMKKSLPVNLKLCRNPIKSKKKGGKPFFGCSNYSHATIKCDFKLWQRPVNEPCPTCGAPFLVFMGTKDKLMVGCADKKCGFKKPFVEPEPAAPAVPHAAEAAPSP